LRRRANAATTPAQRPIVDLLNGADVKRRILIMGLPGAGKTTLANALAPLINAVVFNADAVRANLSRDLGFSHEDRVEHARRMGWMCDRVVEAGGTVIADFICPTEQTRSMFGDAFTIWLDRIDAGRFADTNRMFVQPDKFDLRVGPDGTAQYWAEQALVAEDFGCCASGLWGKIWSNFPRSLQFGGTNPMELSIVEWHSELNPRLFACYGFLAGQ
jgi:hypothetical protein